MESIRVAVFAGPSGGHLFPALAFAESFRDKFPQSRLELITGQKAKRFAAQLETGIFDRVHYLEDFPFPAGISLRTLRFLLKLTKAFFFSFHYLLETKPELCVGFGSYTAYPGLVVSSWRKIPVLIHEQNLIPGKATCWLTRHAKAIAVSFEDTFRDLPFSPRQVVGLPIRRVLVKAALEIGRRKPGSLFRILIVGGSQGAHRLNEIILESFSRFSAEEKRNIAVMHITGKTDHAQVEQSYRKMDVQAEVYPFFDKMQALYSRSDLAITRAGANTLFELALFQVPALVIPYPYAGGHQKANADFFAARQAIMTKDEDKLDSLWLFQQITALKQDLNRRMRMSEALGRLAVPDAALRLVEFSEKLFMKEKSWVPSQTI